MTYRAIQEKYPLFNILVRINNSYFNNVENYNIRLSQKEDLDYLEKLLNSFFNTLKEKNDINTVIKSLLTIMGKILSYQPFYDGNSRTLKKFIAIVLNKLGYKIIYDEKDFIIPMLMGNESCTYEDIQILKRKIKN